MILYNYYMLHWVSQRLWLIIDFFTSVTSPIQVLVRNQLIPQTLISETHLYIVRTGRSLHKPSLQRKTEICTGLLSKRQAENTSCDIFKIIYIMDSSIVFTKHRCGGGRTWYRLIPLLMTSVVVGVVRHESRLTFSQPN